MTRMKIGEFEVAHGTAEIIHDVETGRLHLQVGSTLMILDRDAAYRLLGGLYFYLGLEPPVLPTLLTTAATWLRRFLDRYPQLPLVVEGGQLLVERLEAHARVSRGGPTEQAMWLERLLAAAKDKEQLIGAGSPPRCEWAGLDGAEPQCSAEGTQEIEQRHLCTEHFEYAKGRTAWKRTFVY